MNTFIHTSCDSGNLPGIAVQVVPLQFLGRLNIPLSSIDLFSLTFTANCPVFKPCSTNKTGYTKTKKKKNKQKNPPPQCFQIPFSEVISLPLPPPRATDLKINGLKLEPPSS
jgi:hypothetical protein